MVRLCFVPDDFGRYISYWFPVEIGIRQGSIKAQILHSL